MWVRSTEVVLGEGESVRALDKVARRFAKMGFKVKKRQRRVELPSKSRNGTFTRRQMEEIYEIADRYGARVYHHGDVWVTKPKGKGNEKVR